jgi:hypothetical protein
MIDTYVQLYGEKPRKASSQLEQNDHPEMDDSPFLGQDEMQQFQSLTEPCSGQYQSEGLILQQL